MVFCIVFIYGGMFSLEFKLVGIMYSCFIDYDEEIVVLM